MSRGQLLNIFSDITPADPDDAAEPNKYYDPFIENN
jgi:hypothetical protein